MRVLVGYFSVLFATIPAGVRPRTIGSEDLTIIHQACPAARERRDHPEWAKLIIAAALAHSRIWPSRPRKNLCQKGHGAQSRRKTASKGLDAVNLCVSAPCLRWPILRLR